MSNSPDATRLADIFLIARDVVKEVADNGALAFPIPVKNPFGILNVVEKQSAPTGIEKIELFCHDFRATHLHSTLFRYNDRAEIHYSAHSNVCWRRFSICKELIHLLIDREARHFTTDVASLIETLLVGGVLEPNTPVDSERMGEIAAIEILLPWQLRSVLRSMHLAGETDYQIAVQCRVPLKYVQAMLHGNYGKASDKFNNSLDGKS